MSSLLLDEEGWKYTGDWKARGSEADAGLRLPGDPPGSLRSADGHTQDYYTTRAGNVKRTSGIREEDPAWGGVTLLVGGFVLLVLLLTCFICGAPQWIGAWMVTW